MDRKTNSQRQMITAALPLHNELDSLKTQLNVMLHEVEETHNDYELSHDDTYQGMNRVYADVSDAVKELSKILLNIK